MKNLNLNYEGFENYLVEREKHTCLVRYYFRFENGYSALVVKMLNTLYYPEDLWELGVMKFYDDGRCDLACDVLMGDDIYDHLTDEDVRNLLARIKEL